MPSEIDERKGMGSVSMEGLGDVEEIRLACSEAVQEDQRPGGMGMVNEPTGDADPIAGDQGKRFPRKTVIGGADLWLVPDLMNDPGGADPAPQKAGQRDAEEKQEDGGGL